MKVQQTAIYESLKAFMLKLGFANKAEQNDELWSTTNHRNFKAMMQFFCGVSPHRITVPTKLEHIHEKITGHSHWRYFDHMEHEDTPEASEQTARLRTGMLLGTNTLPSVVDVGGKEVQLGEVVRRAVADSGLDTVRWNNLSEAEHDERCQKALEVMRAEAAASVPQQESTPAPAPAPAPAAPAADITSPVEQAVSIAPAAQGAEASTPADTTGVVAGSPADAAQGTDSTATSTPAATATPESTPAPAPAPAAATDTTASIASVPADAQASVQQAPAPTSSPTTSEGAGSKE